jgi:hypothetical protein
LVAQIAELAARLKRIERWQDQWRTRNRKVAGLQADGVLATDGYLVAPGGLCANRHERYRPPRQTYPSGRTILRAIEPSAEYHSLLPVGITHDVGELSLEFQTARLLRNTTRRVTDYTTLTIHLQDSMTTLNQLAKAVLRDLS